MITYAAYGSNMNRQQMLARTKGDAEAIGTALLRDWQLAFRRGVLTIIPQFGGTVPLALWRIGTQARNALDHYEGAPWLYAQLIFQGVSLAPTRDDVPDEFLIYVMTADGTNTIDRMDVPSATYYETCKQGYADFGLQEWQWVLEAARERALEEVHHG